MQEEDGLVRTHEEEEEEVWECVDVRTHHVDLGLRWLATRSGR